MWIRLSPTTNRASGDVTGDVKARAMEPLVLAVVVPANPGARLEPPEARLVTDARQRRQHLL